MVATVSSFLDQGTTIGTMIDSREDGDLNNNTLYYLKKKPNPV